MSGLKTLVLLQIPIADIWVLVPPHGNSLGWSANYVSIVLFHVTKLWERLVSWEHSCLKTDVGGKQGHALHRNFAQGMYGTMKNKQVKDNNVEESRPLGQAVSLGRLSSYSRVTTDRQSATWRARALGRGDRSKNQWHSPIKLGTWGSLCGKGEEVREELRKRKVDVCGLQEVRWKNKGTRFLAVVGWRYKFWWSGNSFGIRGVGILVRRRAMWESARCAEKKWQSYGGTVSVYTASDTSNISLWTTSREATWREPQVPWQIGRRIRGRES